jgi:hypothetical protein
MMAAGCVQEAGGCLVFCVSRRQCEAQAVAFSTFLSETKPPNDINRALRMMVSMDLLASQAGVIHSPLRHVLDTCTGVAYHHAGTTLRACHDVFQDRSYLAVYYEMCALGYILRICTDNPRDYIPIIAVYVPKRLEKVQQLMFVG